MALTYTPKTEIGQTLPDFSLPTVDGKNWQSDEILAAPAKVVVFMCNHCPYVQAIETRLIQLAADLRQLQVPFIGICANDPTDYPEDKPEALYARWKSMKYDFPYLVDATQEVAHRFGAVCTPDFFVYDKRNQLSYRGRLDDSWKDAAKVTRRELYEAVSGLVQNKKLNFEPIPSMGCSIKWKLEK